MVTTDHLIGSRKWIPVTLSDLEMRGATATGPHARTIPLSTPKFW